MPRPADSLRPPEAARRCLAVSPPRWGDQKIQGGRQSTPSEDLSVLAHATALVLRDALGDPHDVPDLLLLELDEGVVHAVVELLLEGEPVEVHLLLEEEVLYRLVLVDGVRREELLVLIVRVDGSLHGIDVGGHGQARGALGVEEADGRVELLALLFVEVRVERVHRNVDRASVRLQLKDAPHDLRGAAAHLLAEGVEVLEVRLVQRVPDDLNVHLVDVLEREAVAEVGAEGRVDEHHAVELRGGL
mmetsp:Transcript_8010/g.19920  ORF Transcript_8010/g.19920 Transcript_8010/m.19920 type:complete len:246 (-) Transcript_8010:471-1208(-)